MSRREAEVEEEQAFLDWARENSKTIPGSPEFVAQFECWKAARKGCRVLRYKKGDAVVMNWPGNEKHNEHCTVYAVGPFYYGDVDHVDGRKLGSSSADYIIMAIDGRSCFLDEEHLLNDVPF